MALEISTELTGLLQEWKHGNQEAFHELFTLLYPYFQKIAHRKLIGEGYASGLQTNELVQELFLKLNEKDQLDYENRKHFLRLAGVVMHRLLVDLARKRKAQRRGGAVIQVTLDTQLAITKLDPELFIAFDEILGQIKEKDPQMAQILQLRFSAGFSVKEIAEILDLPERTVYRKWDFGKTWVVQQLKSRSASK